MRDAKLEAMGLLPQEDRKPRHDKPQMATDEMVCGTVYVRVVIWICSDARRRSWSGSRNGCEDSITIMIFFS